MLYILCAMDKETEHIKCKNSKIIITGIGICNILKMPKILLKPNDKIINIGYAGSTVYPIGTIKSVNICKRIKPSNAIKEPIQNLKPLFFEGVNCYTADDFIENINDIPLVDMELYYLSLIYPQIQSIKIVSDNLNYKDYNNFKPDLCWQKINGVLNE